MASIAEVMLLLRGDASGAIAALKETGAGMKETEAKADAMAASTAKASAKQDALNASHTRGKGPAGDIAAAEGRVGSEAAGAAGKTEGAAKAVEHSGKAAEGASGSLLKSAAGFAAMGAAGLVLAGGLAIIAEGAKAATEQEAAVTKLNQSLKLTGQVLPVDRLEAAQAGMRKLGTSNVETTNALQALVQAGVPVNEALARMPQLADLAAAKFGGDLSAATEQAIKGTRGMSKSITEMGVVLPTPVSKLAALHAAQATVAKDSAALVAATDKVNTTVGTAHTAALKAAEAAQATLIASQGKLAATTKGMTDPMANFGSVMDQVAGKTGGQAAAASDTLQGKLKVLGVQWDNIEEQVGNRVIPVLTTVAGWLADNLPAIMDKAGQAIGALTVAFGWIADKVRLYVIPAIKVAIDWIKQNVVPPIQQTITAIRNLWDRFGAQILKVLQATFGVVVAIVRTWFKVIGDIIAAVADLFSGNFSGFGQKIKDLVNDIFHGVLEIIGKMFSLLLAEFSLAASLIWAALGKLLGGIVSDIAALPGKAVGALGDVAGKVKSIGVAMVTGIAAAIVGAPALLVAAIWSLKDLAFAGLGRIEDWLLDVGRRLITGLITGIKNMGGALGGAFKDLVGGALHSIPGIGGALGAIGLAEGGTVQPRPGGTLVRLAEGGQPEAVMNPRQMMAFATAVIQNPQSFLTQNAMSSQSNSKVSSTTYNTYVTNPTPSADQISRAIAWKMRTAAA